MFNLGAGEHSCLGAKEQINKYEVKNSQENIKDKNNCHSLIADRVKNNSKVLDVGCATGIMGKMLKDNISCIVDGIELDEAALKIAMKSNNYRKIYHFSITDESTKEFQMFMKNKEKYDYIVFADVLEHLVNPWEAIYLFSKKLSENGQILISIPNLNHLSILENLINNEFNYNTVGILDSTHLRFFTAISFFEMMENYNERYDLPLNVDYFAKTTYSVANFSKDSLFKDENYITVQNIFSLSMAESKEKIKYKNRPKKKNNFKDILDSWNQLQLEKEKLQENINDLQKELQNVYNSKRYRMISKVADFKNKIIRSR